LSDGPKAHEKQSGARENPAAKGKAQNKLSAILSEPVRADTKARALKSMGLRASNLQDFLT
jgi:hypothetical protein